MKKIVLAVALLALAACASGLHAQEELSLASLTKYYIAPLAKGPAWDPEKVKATMEKNRDHIRTLVADGKLVGAVMAEGDQNIRSIFFFKSSKEDEVTKILAGAPSIKAGYLTGSVHEVWGTRGLGEGARKKMKDDPGATLAKENHYLVVYSKGPEWSEETNEKTRDMIGETYASINRLWKSGTLRFFAAMADTKADVRGLGIFAASDADKAMTVASDDPGVKKGWFTARVFPVKIAEGVLP